MMIFSLSSAPTARWTGSPAKALVTSERRRRSSRGAQHTAGAVQKQHESFLWSRMTSSTLRPSMNGAGGGVRGEDTMEVSAAASEALAACGRPENEGRRGGNRPTAELRSCGAAKLGEGPPPATAQRSCASCNATPAHKSGCSHLPVTRASEGCSLQCAGRLRLLRFKRG